MPAASRGELWDLLAPLSPERFIEEHWDRAPLVVPGFPDKLERLLGLSFDPSGFRRVAAALSAQEDVVLRASAERGVDSNGILRASFDHRDYVAGRGERPFVQIRLAQMESMLAAGASIQLGGIESLLFGSAEDARLAVFAERLRTQLHYPGDVLLSATLSPPRARFEAHFDPTGAFILQTSGSKLYQFSKVPVVPWARGKAYVGPDGELRYAGSRAGADAWEQQGPVSPDDMEEPVLMKAGDLFYIPPGVVHRTEALDEWSTSILIIFGQTSFRHFLDSLLAKTKTCDPAWRHLPVWVEGPDGELPASVQRFLGERLGELGALLGDLKPGGLELARMWQELVAYSEVWSKVSPQRAAGEPILPSDVFVRSTRVPVLHASGVDRHGARGLHVFRGKSEFTVPEEWEPFLRRILTEERFVAESCCDWSGGAARYTWDDVAACLETLLQQGLIERA